MKSKSIGFLLALAVPLACSKPAEPPPQPAKNQPAATTADRRIEEVDRDNLLNLAYGASVVSRTSEANLEQSAVHAIDGLYETLWASAPGGRNETLVFSLTAPTRVERIGVTTTGAAGKEPLKVRFEASSDGRTWREIAQLQIEGNDLPQISDVKPFDAEFIRVTTIDAPGYYSYFRSIHAIGKELRPAKWRDFSGCWVINGLTSRIEQDGRRITGVIGTSPPTWIDGGTDGRVAKVMWLRGPTWGHAAMTMSPQMQTIGGSAFFHMVSPFHVGPAWFGKRCERAGNVVPPPADAPSRFLGQARKWSMHGLVFDERERLLEGESRSTLDTLVRLFASAPSQRFRVVAHEVRAADREQNRLRTQARIDALRTALQKRGFDTARIELVAGGSERDKTYVVSSVQRLMVSRVDVEVIP